MKPFVLSSAEYSAASLIAIMIRLLVFIYYIFPHNYYHQPDSADYHYCAASICQDGTMSYPQLREPIFWRTPGYPIFLAPFYKLWHAPSNFKDASFVHWWILLIQLLVCSLLPVLVALLIQVLGGGIWAVRMGMWWSVGHLGSVLSSVFLLSDSLGAIFFIIYLLLFIPSLKPYLAKSTNYSSNKALVMSVGAAIFLGIYTWIRPNGQFFGVVSLLLIASSNISLSKKALQGLIFITVLGAVISPWYIRNYHLTSRIFFCPLQGAYLQTFCAPKIVTRLTGVPLVQCIQHGLSTSLSIWMQDRLKGQQETPIRYSPKELICAQQAWPVIAGHPFFFMQDWLQESFKTTFDLYTYQLVAMAQGTYFYDPPIEFLSEKLWDCLINQTTPLWIRLIGWIETVLTAIIWLLILASLYKLVIPSLFNKNNDTCFSWYWLVSAFIAISACGMTGGFGYARLRLCIEPLFWAIAALSTEKLFKLFKGI